MDITDLFSPAGWGPFTSSVLINKIWRFISAFLLIGIPVPRNIATAGLVFPYSSAIIGLIFFYCSIFAALVLVFVTAAGLFGATNADLVITYSSIAAGFPFFEFFKYISGNSFWLIGQPFLANAINYIANIFRDFFLKK